MVLSEKAVLCTVLYADIFNFPLTRDEIWMSLISGKQIDRDSVNRSIAILVGGKVLFEDRGYLSIKKDKKYSTFRIDSEKILVEKLKHAQKAALILAEIPSVDLIGISGGVAVGNVKSADDIDFFIVARKEFLWTTRLMCVLSLFKHGLRRSRRDNNVANKICLNMFISSDSLAFPVSDRDVYTAHEIAQVTPIFSRAKTYETLIEENSWIKNYLPNFKIKTPIFIREKSSDAAFRFMYKTPMIQLAKYLQKMYMLPHRTTETVTDKVLAFHPGNYHIYVLKEYRERIKHYQ